MLCPGYFSRSAERNYQDCKKLLRKIRSEYIPGRDTGQKSEAGAQAGRGVSSCAGEATPKKKHAGTSKAIYQRKIEVSTGRSKG